MRHSSQVSAEDVEAACNEWQPEKGGILSFWDLYFHKPSGLTASGAFVWTVSSESGQSLMP